MSDRVLLSADHLVPPPSLEPMAPKFDLPVPHGEGTSKQPRKHTRISLTMDEFEFSDEEEEYGQKTECRFCQEEDSILNMEAPCACKGTIKFAHRKCVQKWCNAKESIICEICHELYQPNYSAPAPQIRRSQTDLSDTLAGPGGPRLLLHSSSTVLQTEGTERLVEECDINETAGTGGKWCDVVLIVQALFLCCNALFLTLLLCKNVFLPRHEDNTSTVYHITLGILVPSYITSFVINYWQSCKNKPEILANIETPEIAIVIDPGDHGGAVGQRLQGVFEPEVVSESEDPPFVS